MPPPILRPAIRRSAWHGLSQKRHAQVHNVRFVTTQPDAVLDRYRAKLAQKAREKGVTVDELRQANRTKLENQRKNASPNPPQNNPTPFNPPPPPKPQVPSTLNTLLNTPKLSTLSHPEIESLWRAHHINDPSSLCAVINLPTFRKMEVVAKQHPQFILPLPKTDQQGAEIHFLQWTFPTPTTATVLFTHLAEYKCRGEYAQPHTTLTHHLDLEGHAQGGVVLMEGRVTEGRGVTVQDAKWLVMCLQKFYGLGGGRRRGLMELFTRGDERFRVEELLEEAERVP
ncbi:ATP11-domain-containing protein [Piedraia hortae CBS 480.64]|uniref:ATP11-domain-containing protein n=1 Tax=Piedraia hortae CBS 480.64 TaxID=1314780 RepID=A0A6A7BQ31_9PEZI|nr:ATP11-domain-containing protein [Piedraia hortae CBS 480.64]